MGFSKALKNSSRSTCCVRVAKAAPSHRANFFALETTHAHRGASRLPVQRAAGSMPLFRMSGAASGADMNFTMAIAASGRLDTASTPAENTT